MEGHNRFFIVGLFVIGLVGVHAENREDLSVQKPNEHEALNAESRETLFSIEHDEVQPAAEGAFRILRKRSNPNRYGGMSKDEYDFTVNEALNVFSRESAASTAQKMANRRANQRAREAQQAQQRRQQEAAEAQRRQQQAQQAQRMQQAQQAQRMQQAQQAQRAQQQAFQARPGQPGSSQHGQRPGSSQYGPRPGPSRH